MAPKSSKPIVPKGTPPKQQQQQQASPGAAVESKKRSYKHTATQAAPKQQAQAATISKAAGAKRRHQPDTTSAPAAKKHQPSIKGNQDSQQPALASVSDAAIKGSSASTKRAADSQAAPRSARATTDKAGQQQQQPAPAAEGQAPHKKRKKASKAAEAGAPNGAASAAGGVSANWAALRQRIGATGEGAKRRAEREKAAGRKPASMGSNTGVTPVLALDCEMVGVGPEGARSALARVAVVNQEGNTLLDVFVKTKEKVVDYRTKHSGVRPSDLSSDSAVELEEAQARVAALIKDRILVGHGLVNDMTALMLDHPRKDIRDTAKYPPFMRSPAPGRRPKPRALRHLASEQLGLDIQAGEHSPVDDARAALYLYLKHRKDWEHAIKTGGLKRSVQTVKEARKAALTAAVAAATAASSGGAAGAAGAANGKAVLSKAQLRALRQGRSLRKTKGLAPAASGPAAGKGRAKAGPAGMQIDQDEVQQLVAAAAADGARGVLQGGKRAQAMMQIMTRDVKHDPMADL